MIYLILLVGLILRLVLINQSFWLDEATQAITSSKGLSYVFFQNTADFHPPFSYALTSLWMQISSSEIWLRLLPIFFGISTIWICYLIGTRLFSKRIGLLTALFLAINPYHIYYSQEFRMYSMITFFVSLSMYFFISILNKKSKHKYFVFYVLSCVAILYTHYLGGLIILTQLIYTFAFERGSMKKLLILQGIVGLFFLPWIPTLAHQLTIGSAADSVLPGWSQMLSLSLYKAIPLLFVKFTIGRISFENNLNYSLVILFVLFLFSFIFWKLRKIFFTRKVGVITLWFGIPVILTFVISFKLPMFDPFRLLYALPALMFLLVLGLNELDRYKKALITLIISIFLFGNIWFWINPRFWREDWKGAMEYLKTQQSSSQVIYTAWPKPFDPMLLYGDSLNMKGSLSKMPALEGDIQKNLDNLDTESDIYFVSYLSQLSDPQNLIRNHLEELGFKLLEVKDFRGVGFIYHYGRVPSYALKI